MTLTEARKHGELNWDGPETFGHPSSLVAQFCFLPMLLHTWLPIDVWKLLFEAVYCGIASTWMLVLILQGALKLLYDILSFNHVKTTCIPNGE